MGLIELMVEPIPFQAERYRRFSGGGPEDPMLEARVARLEDDLKEVKSSLKSLEVTLARLDGRISQLPTAWTMFTAIITTVVATWGAGAAIVFTLLRFSRP